MKVWAIFSIENQYYQPENNLEKLYKSKPSYEQLVDFFFSQTENLTEQEDMDIRRILSGEEVRPLNEYGADYRIEEVEVTE